MLLHYLCLMPLFIAVTLSSVHLSNSGAVSLHANERFNLKFRCRAHEQSTERSESFFAQFGTHLVFY